jgi:hypothetical protein
MGKLFDQFRREAEQDSQNQLNELVGGSDETQDRRGGFAAACTQSRWQAIDRRKGDAIDTLVANPALIASITGEARFREMFKSIPDAEMSALINEFRKRA